MKFRRRRWVFEGKKMMGDVAMNRLNEEDGAGLWARLQSDQADLCLKYKKAEDQPSTHLLIKTPALTPNSRPD
jgi:hypothetical protein